MIGSERTRHRNTRSGRTGNRNPRSGIFRCIIRFIVDTGTPGVKIEMSQEATDLVKSTGVAENEEDTYPKGTDEDDQYSRKIGDDAKSLTDEVDIENRDKENYHPSALAPSTQAVYGMDCLSNNQKQGYRYRFSEIMHHAMTQVSLKRGLKQLKEKGEKSVSK